MSTTIQTVTQSRFYGMSSAWLALITAAVGWTLYVQPASAADFVYVPPPQVTFEVILRGQHPMIEYPGTVPTTSLALSASHFGATPQNAQQWRGWDYATIANELQEWIDDQPNFVYPRVVGLNFEKIYSWLEEENHNSIEHAVAATRALLSRGGVAPEVGLYGMPFPESNDCQNPGPDGFCEYPYYLANKSFADSLNLDFSIPVLYVKRHQRDDETNWILRVEERTQLALSLSEIFGLERRPYLWHLINIDPSVLPPVQTPLLTFDEHLMQTLGLQATLLDEAGIERAFFWSAQDDPVLAETIDVLLSPCIWTSQGGLDCDLDPPMAMWLPGAKVGD